MKHAGALPGVLFGIALIVGCGAADEGNSPENEGALPTTAADGATANGANGAAANGATANGATANGATGAPQSTAANGDQTAHVETGGTDLARIEFPDGNVVRFEELDGGVLITELGQMANPRHFIAEEGMTSLEAFQQLAPGQDVPAGLAQMHEKLYPSGAVLSTSEGALEPDAALRAPSPASDRQDLPRTGQFQQSGGLYPWAQFAPAVCNFADTSKSYKHGNATSGHSHNTADVHTAYFAVGSDIGIVAAKACSNGACGASVTVQAGYSSSGYYDAGLSCTQKSCSWWDLVCHALGNVQICTNKKVKFTQTTTAISSQVRMHDCASFTW